MQHTNTMTPAAIAFRLEIEAQLGGRDQALELFRAALREDDQDGAANAAWWAVIRAGEAAAELVCRYPILH